MTTLTVNEAARIVHETLAAYCEALGDHSQPLWHNAEPWQVASSEAAVRLHLHQDLGPEASHLAWCEARRADGWIYGAVKDATLKQHPCLVPFDKLPLEQQIKDTLVLSVVQALRPLIVDEPA